MTTKGSAVFDMGDGTLKTWDGASWILVQDPMNNDPKTPVAPKVGELVKPGRFPPQAGDVWSYENEEGDEGERVFTGTSKLDGDREHYRLWRATSRRGSESWHFSHRFTDGTLTFVRYGSTPAVTPVGSLVGSRQWVGERWRMKRGNGYDEAPNFEIIERPANAVNRVRFDDGHVTTLGDFLEVIATRLDTPSTEVGGDAGKVAGGCGVAFMASPDDPHVYRCQSWAGHRGRHACGTKIEAYNTTAPTPAPLPVERRRVTYVGIDWGASTKHGASDVREEGPGLRLSCCRGTNVCRLHRTEGPAYVPYEGWELL